MLSLPLLRTTIKFNYVIWLIFAGILAMYLSIIASMFDPTTMENMDGLIASLPPQLVDAMNFKTTDASFLGFLAGYFYGFLILLFPSIYSILMADRMIARHVDSGAMAFLLSTPNTRQKIAFTQAVFLVGSMTLLIVFVALVGIAAGEALFPGELDIPGFVLLNVGAALLYFALTGIGFLASCLFNESKYSLALGGGIIGLFFMLKILSGVGEEVAFVKYLSLMSLFDPAEITAGGSGGAPAFLAMTAIGLACYAAGIYIFGKKDLPL
jgi:ABC-2 type transport system permease protein